MSKKPTYVELEQKLRNTFTYFLVFLIFSACVSITFAHDNQSKSVLILHSYHKGQQWSDDITKGIESVLNSNGQNIELFFEYMDTKRIYDDLHLNNFYQLLRHKYSHHKLDAIICADDHAFNFILKRSNDLFPKTPTVFCGVNRSSEAMLTDRNWITGVVESTDLGKTIEIALQLHPGIKNVFVLVDKTVSGMVHRKLIEGIMSQFNTLTFDISDDVELPIFKEKLQKMSKSSIVLWMNLFGDKFGNLISMEDVTALLQRYCNVPVYSLWAPRLGKGIVGGMLISGFAQGETAAQIVLRILHGEKVKDIPIVKESANRYMFDYQQMQRFDIKPSALPTGSVILNQPSSFYYDNKGLVWSVVACIAGLVFIILFLSFHIFYRRRAERALQVSEERLAESNQLLAGVLEHTHMMAVFLDPQFNFIWVNSAYADTCKHESSFFPGKNHFDLYPHEENQAIFQRVVDTGEPFFIAAKPFEFSDQPERGVTYWDWSLIPVKDGTGKVTGLVFTLAEVTEHIRIEAALRESEDRYRTFFDQGPDGVVVLDPETAKLIEFNDQACRQLGYSQEEFALLRVFDIEAKETAEETKVHIRKIQSEGYDDFETLQRTKQGEDRHIHVTAQVIEIAGRPVYHCIWRDITDRKQAEEEIKSSLKEKEVLLSEIHHRVKNNMQVIISLLRLQSDKVEDNKYADMFKESEDRIRSMALIHEQLYQSKDFANIHFGEYIKSLVNGLYTSHGVDTNRIKLNIDIKDVSFDLENAIPCGLIINELVSNALKHAFPGERKGEIEISLHTINEGEIELTVSDDGVGIPEDLDIRVAESMGLHIVRILAEQTLAGKMELNRTEGTQFHFILKRSKYKPRI